MKSRTHPHIPDRAGAHCLGPGPFLVYYQNPWGICPRAGIENYHTPVAWSVVTGGRTAPQTWVERRAATSCTPQLPWTRQLSGRGLQCLQPMLIYFTRPEGADCWALCIFSRQLMSKTMWKALWVKSLSSSLTQVIPLWFKKKKTPRKKCICLEMFPFSNLCWMSLWHHWLIIFFCPAWQSLPHPCNDWHHCGWPHSLL